MNASSGALVKSYKIENAAGVTQYAAVVAGANADGNCKLPTAANAAGFLGVTLEAQPNQLKGVAVQKNGICRATANGTITRGDRLAIATNVGDVKSVEASITGGAGVYLLTNVIGRAEESAVAGQIFAMFICPETVIQPAS